MKIEKLKPNDRGDGFLTPATPNDMYWKINEIIDAVNVIAADIDGIKKRLPPMFTVDTKTTNQVSEIIQREERFQEMRIHFGKAIQMLKAIASGEAPDGHPDCRKDPRFTTGGISSVRLLAQVAMDELETALAGADALHQPQNKGTENENH